MSVLKQIFISVTQIFFCAVCFAQTKEIDSLKKQLPGLKDSAKALCLGKLGVAYRLLNADSAAHYARAAYNEAEKIHHFTYMANSLMLESWVYGHDNFPLTERNSREAIRLYNKSSNAHGLARAYDRLGLALMAQSSFEEAILVLDTAAELSKKIRDTASWTNALVMSAMASGLSGNTEKAFEKLNEVLTLSRQSNHKDETLVALTLMGEFFKGLEDYETALEYFRQAFQGFKPVDYRNYPNPDRVVVYASLFLETHQYDSFKYYLGLLDTTRARARGMYRGAMADYYLHVGDYDKALQLTLSGNSMIEKETDINAVALTTVRVAKLYLLKQNREAALRYAWSGLALGRKVKSRLFIRDACNVLYSIYQQQQNTDSAFFYYREYVSMNDSILTSQIRGKLAAAGLSQKVELLNKEKEVQQAKLQKESILKNIFIGSVIVLIILGFIIFRNIRLRRRNEKMHLEHELDLQKLESEKTKAELQKQATELEMQALQAATREQLTQSEKMASLGELTSGIAHEIKNPLNFINNFSEINMELITEIEEEQIPNLDEKNKAQINSIIKTLKKNSEKINHHGKRVDGIVKGMLQHSRLENTSKELVDINSLCDESLKLAWHGFKAKEKTFNASFETRFDPDLPNVMVFPQDLGRVMINLINNAFYTVHEKKKRSQSESLPETLQTESLYKPSVIVSTKKNGNKIFITVSDNGMGIPSPIMNKIFQPFFTTKPTGEGTGLGLSMSYDIISKSHGGEIRAKSKEGLGTDFEIMLPLS